MRLFRFAAIVIPFCIVLGSYAQTPPRFLTLPFSDSTVKIQQGWLYTNGQIHRPEGAFDYIKGSIDQSATWQGFDVVAAADGVAVWDDDPNSGYGNVVVIKHDQTDQLGRSYFTLYAHLQDNTINPSIPKLGRKNTQYQNWFRVRAGESLGVAGTTGSQGCRIQTQCTHLHFEVRVGGYRGTPIDPYDISLLGATPYSRSSYPGGSNFSDCGGRFLWTACPPAVAVRNTVATQATLNGQPFSGPLNYNIEGPNRVIIGTSVPANITDLPSGQYILVYQSGGPEGSVFTGVTPSAVQNLSAGSSILFTLNFGRFTTSDVLPYRSSGYRFRIIGQNETSPSGFELPGFDDSSWGIGTAAFGYSVGYCPWGATIASSWPVNSRLLVRKSVSLPANSRNVRIKLMVDNDVAAVYFNGVQVSNGIQHVECPVLDNYEISVPQSLIQSGANHVTYHLYDYGFESYFDTRIIADIPALP